MQVAVPDSTNMLAAAALLASGLVYAGEPVAPIASHDLLGTLEAALPVAPPLAPTLADERLAASFVIDLVDGIARPVYEMPAVEINGEALAGGLDLDGTTLGMPTTYTLELLAAFEATDEYVKLADFSQRVLDEGWYVYENSTLFFEETDEGDALLVPETYFLLTLTRTAEGAMALYIDGVPVSSFDDVDDFGAVSGPIGLFIDDSDTVGENTTTRAARVTVFDRALSPAEVLARAEARDTDRLLGTSFEAIPGTPQAR